MSNRIKVKKTHKLIYLATSILFYSLVLAEVTKIDHYLGLDSLSTNLLWQEIFGLPVVADSRGARIVRADTLTHVIRLQAAAKEGLNKYFLFE